METAEVVINYSNIDTDATTKCKITKMTLLYNALEGGWKIEKNGTVYIFSKKHENRQEIVGEKYLSSFFKEYIHNNK